MQNHVKLEIALEVVTNKIAQTLNKIKKDDDEKLKEELQYLMKLKDEAYKGNFEAVETILNNKKGNENG